MEKKTGSALVPPRIAQRAHSYIKSVCQQILRFAKMPVDEYRNYLNIHPNEVFFYIPRPDGRGNLSCGAIGWKKLGDLADLALDLERGIGRRVGRERVRTAVTDAFGQRILHEALEVNQETAELILRDTLVALKNSLAVTEHFLPIVLFAEDFQEEFCVGPVRFAPKKKFFNDRKQAFKRSIQAVTAAHVAYVSAAVAQGLSRERAFSEAQSRQSVRRLQAQAVKTYRNYPWIAIVKVTDCDKDTAKERAIRAVEMALHVLRILLGAGPTRELRHAWSLSNALRTAHLHADVDGVIHASVGMSFLGSVGPKNWHAALVEASHELMVFGWVLESIVDPVEITHLHQRLIDAINWFGDAATDSKISSSIVKYVAAIERLLFGKFESGRTRAFANRVRTILEAFGCEDSHLVYDQALDLYKTRSTLVHGEYILIEEELHKILRIAESLSRMCLICSVQLYPMMAQAFDRPDPAKLEEIMKRIGSEGLAWLAEASGFSKTQRFHS